MNLESKFYYGLPISIWDSLLFKAEDLLRDENLGSHLVGIFPAGGRIFGIESESPGIFCLYIDSVESLIDPFLYKQAAPEIYHIGNNNNLIIMMDIWAWAKMLIDTGRHTSYEHHQYILQLLPFGNAFHIDGSVQSILEAGRELVRKTISLYRHRISSLNKLTNALTLRTMALFSESGDFYPCTNKDWDYVHKEDLDWISSPDKQDIISNRMTHYHSVLVSKEPQSNGKYLHLQKQLGSEVAKLYRSLI